MGENWFHLFVTLYLFLNGLWWSKRGGLNLSVKFIFWILAMWGLLVCLHDWGFIIKQ